MKNILIEIEVGHLNLQLMSEMYFMINGVLQI